MTIIFKGREIPSNLAEMVRPQHAAIVIHDMQNDLVGKGGVFDKAGVAADVSALVPRIADFVAKARGKGVRVMYTNYTNLPDYGTFTDPLIYQNYDAILDPSKFNPYNAVIDGTWGWQTINELAPQEGDIIIKKYRVDSFIGTNFEIILRSNSIRTIIHTGVATDRGIMPTAGHAASLGFFPVVPEDCAQGGAMKLGPEAMKFLRKIAFVTTSAEILAAWD